MILRREVPPQQAHGGEGHLSRGEQIQDHREAPAGPGGLDAIARGVFREPKGLGAIAEEGPIGLGGVDGGTGIERGQVGHQLDRRFALRTREHVEAREEILIRQSGRDGEDVCLHASLVSPRISRAGQGPGRLQEGAQPVRSADPLSLYAEGSWRGAGAPKQRSWSEPRTAIDSSTQKRGPKLMGIAKILVAKACRRWA